MKRIAIAVLIVLIALAALPIAAQALLRQTQPAAPAGSPASAAAAGPLYTHQYAGFEFRPLASDLTYGAVGTGIYATSVPVPPKSFRLPLALPNGAQVLTTTVYFVDNDPSQNMTFRLISFTAALTSSVQIAVVDSALLANTTAIQSLSMTGNPLLTIDNANAGYALQYVPVITGTDHILVGARIDFTVPTAFLPMVEK